MMTRYLEITPRPIEEAELMGHPSRAPGNGAVVSFLGVVRDREGEARVAGIEYEAFKSMAQRQFQLLFDEMEGRWPVASVRLIHRVGFVRANEASLWVEVAAPHRAEAFAACEWLIDSMKRTVPIWKKPRRPADPDALAAGASEGPRAAPAPRGGFQGKTRP